MTNEQIEAYVQQLNEIVNRVGDTVVAARILSEIAKDRRMAALREDRNGNGNGNGPRKQVSDPNAPATAAQIGYIKSLGGNPGRNMTKGEASEMLDQLTGNGR